MILTRESYVHNYVSQIQFEHTLGFYTHLCAGLPSSLDRLLERILQADHSEYNLPPSSSSHGEDTDAETLTPVAISDQAPLMTKANELAPQINLSTDSGTRRQPLAIPLPDSFHQEQVKDDTTCITDTIQPEIKSKGPQTDSSPRQSVAHDLSVQASSSDTTDKYDQTLTLSDSYHHEQCNFPKDQSTLMTDQTAAIETSTSTAANEPHQVMFRYNDKLITALSADPLGIAGVLVTKGFIPEHTEAQMRLISSTPREKATILVTTIRQRIEIAPKRFHEFLSILSEQAWTKDIMEVLQSHTGHEHLRRDVSVQVVSIGDHGSTDTGRKSSSDSSSNGDYHAFSQLNSEDKAELEAHLILSADSMRKKFAALLVNVIKSFKEQNVEPTLLISAVLALTEHNDPAIGKPLLEREREALMKAQSVDHIFHVLRPHMTFFNYEILEFLIEVMGSDNDKHNLQKFLQEFRRFCRRSVFEIPANVLGHGTEKGIDQQKFCIKITKQFKAALLVHCSKEQTEPDLQTTSSIQASSSEEAMAREGMICAPELGISLEDAKHIQRKLASVLKLKVSSIYLDSALSGSTILTFLLPSHISLAGLDSDPDIIALASNGIHILCGPPGKPEQKELTSSGLVMQWSPPEYGCDSLAQYILYYQKQCKHDETSEWQMIKLNSLETHTCVPDLNDGDTYVFKICTVSDVGTLQYSNESDPIVLSTDRILTNSIHKIIVANKDMLTSAFSLADPNIIAVTLSVKEVISKKDEAQINLTSTPSEKAIILVTAIENGMKRGPEKFQTFLNTLSEAKLSLPGDVVETLWSEYYDSVYEQYLDYLKYLYASLDKKQTTSNQWPPSATKKFFRLAMIKTTTVRRGYINDRFVQMTITGKVDDILLEKSPIQLEDIFKETKGQRKVILLEGAPGCGKSTLSVYICQQWEKGQLFNQFQLVILIRLRDPAVKNAKGLADLLPCPDTKTAQQIAARMLANKCRDILFILDGWDELPPNLRKDSIFHKLVQPKLPQSNQLCESTVIVTSRPISSGDLHKVVSSRVEILGFTAEELYQFFTECLKGDTEAVKTLLEKIEEHPEVAGSCYLPLNATILVHLFKSDRNTLPTTLYGIFSSLVLNCMQRHLKLRTQYKDVSIESLDQLPEVAKKPFLVLCQLAYDGVMEGKIIFTSLPADVNTLSLLQGVESFIGREKAVSYNFIHLSIQELLAAWYIATQLPASEQVSKFNELFHTSRFSAIFQYYSAITKLKTPGIKDVVINVVKKYSRNQPKEDKALMLLYGSGSIPKDKVLLLSLLHCLYEAQDPSLCESVAQQLQHGLDLMYTTLTPSDCLCIGYFLAHVCKMSAGEFIVNLERCSIGDQGCKYLVSGLHKCLDTHSAVTTLLNIDMGHNSISHHGVHHLTTLLKIACTDHLNLSYNNLLSEQDTIHATIDTFTEQLKYNTTLKTLWLVRCGLTSLSAESLAEALTTNKHLKVLSISVNALCDDGIQHLAHALRVNQGLKKLSLLSCGMTDVGLECLTKSLQHNNVLTQLEVRNFDDNRYPNRITEKIVPVLTECLQNNYTLTELELPTDLKSFTTSIEEAVNDVRKRSGLPLIEVTGMYVPLNEESM